MLVRWFQFGTFCPVMRLHGCRQPAQQIINKAAESAKKAGREGIVRKGFTRLLALGLRHRILTIVAAFGTLGIALFLVLNLGMQFFPGND